MYFEYLKRLFRKSYINILEYNAIGIIDFLVFRVPTPSNTFQNHIFTLFVSNITPNKNT